jgi:uncharacterized repeat protein (TIGR02543 family)
MVGCAGGGGVKYNLIMAVAPAGAGTAADVTNLSPYAAETPVAINAVANPGYQFVNWTAPAGTFTNATAAQTSFTMPAENVTVTAKFAAQFAGGSGTEDAPFEISNWYQLDSVGNYLDSYFVLMNDLDSTTAGYEELASETANNGTGWQPIGIFDSENSYSGFTGVFDGNGNEIRDLFIYRAGSPTGLFGIIWEGAVIKNVSVVNFIVTGDISVGGLVGEQSGGSVSNCYCSGIVTGTLQQVGGLVGGNFGGTVNNCHSCGNISGLGAVGGLVGAVVDGIVTNSYSNCRVTGGGEVGGLVGDITINTVGSTVSNSYSTGSVMGEGVVGGLAGSNYCGTIDGCYSHGNVICDGSGPGNNYVGGLVGVNEGTVSNSYSTGNVTGPWAIGGLVGLNGVENCGGIINDCYSTGRVTGDGAVGGLAGQNPGTITDSFWDTETSGQATSDGGTGKTTGEMKDIGTFSGASWNITAVANPSVRNPAYSWNIVDNVTYPFLSWEPVS